MHAVALVIPPRYLFGVKKSAVKSPGKLTTAALKSAVGNTWFDLTESENCLSFDTRDHGDVGSETPGKPDIVEARRIAAAVRTMFPRHEVRLETVDEWVMLEVSKSEKSKTELDREARRQDQEKRALKLVGDWSPHIESALSLHAQKCLGENSQSKNYAAPFSWSRTVAPGEKSCATTFRSEYGERHLYRDHHGVIPAFKTPDESRAHFAKLIRGLGGIVKAEIVENAHKKLTYNLPAPNNVIEETGCVTYSVELPLSPPCSTPARHAGLPLGKSVQRSGRSSSAKTL